MDGLKELLKETEKTIENIKARLELCMAALEAIHKSGNVIIAKKSLKELGLIFPEDSQGDDSLPPTDEGR